MSTNGSVSVSPIEYYTFGTEDYCVFVVMLALSSAIGIYFGFFGKGQDTTAEYLLGGKQMKTLPIAISLVASQLSGITIVAIPAETYSHGIAPIFEGFAMFFIVPLLCWIIIPVFYENNILNCYQYLELRFNTRTCRLVTAIFVITTLLLLPILIFVPALTFSQVTGTNINLINAIVCFICVFYTMLGGIKAVVWTDVVQGSIMLSSCFLVGILGINKTGGLRKVVDYAVEGGRLHPNLKLDLTTRTTFWNVLIGGVFLWTPYVGLNQSCVQRIVSLPSLAHARRALVIFGFGFLFIYGSYCLIGIVIYARYHDCDPVKSGLVSKYDRLMPFFVQDIVGHIKGMPGVFTSAVFSAALSTMSATLNSLSGVVYFEYIKPFINHSERKANFIMKTFISVTGVYCVLGGLIVQRLESILQMFLAIGGLANGTVLGIFTLGMLVPKAHGKAGFYALILSLAVVIWIFIGAQIQVRSGQLKYFPLPTGTDGCEDLKTNVTYPIFFLNSTIPPTSNIEKSEPFSIHRISFHWYKVIGAICVWIFAIPLSFILSDDNQRDFDPKLLTPFVRKFYPAKHMLPSESIPLKVKRSKHFESASDLQLSKNSF